MSLLFTGDLYPGRNSAGLAAAGLQRLPEADLMVTNFEGVIEPPSSAGMREDKSAILTIDEATLDAFLAAVRLPVFATLGNNHIHDMGQPGIDATREAFSHRGVRYAGVGLSSEVQHPAIIADGPVRIALLPTSSSEPEVMARTASPVAEGVLDWGDHAVEVALRNARNWADYVVVLPHWGREHLEYPAANLRQRAYRWIDAGADLVVGTHPHIIQGKEQYAGRWIYYSLGNFLFAHFFTKEGLEKTWNESSNRSVLLRVSFSNEISVEEHGLQFDPDAFEIRPSQTALAELRERSQPLHTAAMSHKAYFSFWERQYLQAIRRERHWWRVARNAYFPRHHDYGTFRYFIRRSARRLRQLFHD